jgi:hypothetical protein
MGVLRGARASSRAGTAMPPTWVEAKARPAVTPATKTRNRRTRQAGAPRIGTVQPSSSPAAVDASPATARTTAGASRESRASAATTGRAATPQAGPMRCGTALRPAGLPSPAAPSATARTIAAAGAACRATSAIQGQAAAIPSTTRNPGNTAPRSSPRRGRRPARPVTGWTTAVAVRVCRATTAMTASAGTRRTGMRPRATEVSSRPAALRPARPATAPTSSAAGRRRRATSATTVWSHYTRHGRTASLFGPAACGACHGTDYRGGWSDVSCYECHVGPYAVHTLGWAEPWAHGAVVESNGSDGCTECHGADLRGGGSGVSCWLCHEGPNP